MIYRAPRALCTLASLLTLSVALAGGAAAAEPQRGQTSAGDLGLGELDQPPPSSPRDSAKLGLGLNATLQPSVFGTAAVAQAFSLRIWLERLIIEPLLGLGFIAPSRGSATVSFNTGVLLGYALKMGNLRPYIGGGLTLGILSSSGTKVGMTFGPMFGLEYRFTELPALGFDAALFLPFNMEFDPFIFSLATAGSVLIGFHYYF